MTLGAGVQWYEAYTAVNEHGRIMVGGISPGGSVGAAGGWLASGGHSFLLPVVLVNFLLWTPLLVKLILP